MVAKYVNMTLTVAAGKDLATGIDHGAPYD